MLFFACYTQKLNFVTFEIIVKDSCLMPISLIEGATASGPLLWISLSFLSHGLRGREKIRRHQRPNLNEQRLFYSWKRRRKVSGSCYTAMLRNNWADFCTWCKRGLSCRTFSVLLEFQKRAEICEPLIFWRWSILIVKISTLQSCESFEFLKWL